MALEYLLVAAGGAVGAPCATDRPVRADQARFAVPLGTLSETARLAEQRARFFATPARAAPASAPSTSDPVTSADFQQSPAATSAFRRHPISLNKAVWSVILTRVPPGHHQSAPDRNHPTARPLR
jgi:hypothetical protein